MWCAIEEFFEEAKRRGEPLAFVDAALMVETGSHECYDVLVIVTCSEDLQRERLMARDCLSASEAEQRIAAQMPIGEKRRYGDYVIDTSGSFQRTIARAEEVLSELRAPADDVDHKST